MKQDTKRPLYKVLNEQRTQGGWEVNPHTFNKRLSKCTIGIKGNIHHSIFNAEFHKQSQSPEKDTQIFEANAKYTALAVNNLHHLAEALEGALKTINTLAGELNYQSTRWDNEHIKPIEEALSRIS